MKRQHIAESTITNAKRQVSEMVTARLKEKGKGTFASTHEITGILLEEFDELVLAQRGIKEKPTLSAPTRQATRALYKKELIDIAVACVIGIASIDGDTVDW